jgi:hypothetical protein
MIHVTETINKILKQKQAQLVSGDEAMRKLLLELERQVLAELGQAALSSWDSYRLKQLLDSIERRIADYDLAAKKEVGTHINTMWGLGQESVYKPLEVAGIFSGFNLSTSVLKTLETFAFHKLSNVSASLMDKIRGELMLGSLGTKTPQQVADAIGASGITKVAGNKIFPSIAARSEFVVKTELGRVYSEAANRRMTTAAQYVDGLEKMWHHGHPKVPRPVHLEADGVSVPVNKPFPIRDKNGYQLMYPHDPAADFSEVAGCQCDSVPWMASWRTAKTA